MVAAVAGGAHGLVHTMCMELTPEVVMRADASGGGGASAGGGASGGGAGGGGAGCGGAGSGGAGSGRRVASWASDAKTQRILLSRRKLVCALCSVKGWVTVQCAHGKCHMALHAVCAAANRQALILLPRLRHSVPRL